MAAFDVRRGEVLHRTLGGTETRTPLLQSAPALPGGLGADTECVSPVSTALCSDPPAPTQLSPGSALLSLPGLRTSLGSCQAGE